MLGASQERVKGYACSFSFKMFHLRSCFQMSPVSSADTITQAVSAFLTETVPLGRLGKGQPVNKMYLNMVYYNSSRCGM